MANRVLSQGIIKTFIEFSDKGDIAQIDKLSQWLSPTQQSAVQRVIKEMAPDGNLPKGQKEIFKEKIISLVGRGSGHYKVLLSHMDRILPFLTPEETLAATKAFRSDEITPLFLDFLSCTHIDLDKVFQIPRPLASLAAMGKVCRLSLKNEAVIKGLSAPQSLSKLDPVLSDILSYLHPEEIALLTRVNRFFHNKACHSLVTFSYTVLSDSIMKSLKRALKLVSYVELLHIHPSGISKIRELASYDKDIFINLIESSPYLRSAYIVNDLGNDQVQTFIEKHPLLETAELQQPSSLVLSQVIKAYPKLQKISIYIGNITDQDLENLTTGCLHLTDIILMVGRVGSITSKGLLQIANAYSKLTCVEITRCGCLNDDVVIALARNNPHLESVCFCFSEGITDKGISELVTLCPNLSKINLAGCKDLTEKSLMKILDLKNLKSITPDVGKLEYPLILKLAKDLRVDSAADKMIYLRNELSYQPTTSLGQIYLAAIKQESPETIQKLLSNLGDEKFANLLYYHIWERAGSPSGDDNWGRNHALEDLDRLILALRESIVQRLAELPSDDQIRVYEAIYRLHGNPKTRNSRSWGKIHAEDNLSILADALTPIK